MDTNYSKEALLQFVNFVSDKALVKPVTAKNWRTAIVAVFNNLSPEEEADVRTIDIDLAVHKVANRNPNVSPQSLQTYKQRVITARGEFITWRENPVVYKPKGINISRERAKSVEGSKKIVQHQSNPIVPEKPVQPTVPEITPNTNSLQHNYPLRPDFLAQVVVPRDMTFDEAKRIGAFLTTLAVDFKPT